MVLFGPKFSIFYFKQIIYSEKKRCSLKIAVPEFSVFLKSKYLLFGVFLKFIFNQKEKRGFIQPKIFDFLFQKHSSFYSEKKSCSLKVAGPEFQKYIKSQLSILAKSVKNKHEHEFSNRYFSRIFLTFQENRFKGTPLSGCFRLFQWRGFAREYIFPRKKLLPGVFKFENITLQTISRGILISCMEYLFTSKQVLGDSYFPVIN